MDTVTSEDDISLWLRPGFLVRRLHQISVAIFLDEMADLEITPVQFGAMSVIAANPGIDQSAIGVELGIDRANIADVVTRLSKSGLLRREPSPRDGRVKNVYLTDKGAELLAEANRRFRRVQQRLLQPFSEEERSTFLRLLLRVVQENNSLGRAVLRLKAGGGHSA